MKLAIIDFNGTMYDPFAGSLMPGARELLESCQQKGITMVLVSKQVLGREGLPKQLGIADYFADLLFVDEKTGKLFKEIMRNYGAKPEDTIVIGDYLPSEIQAGNDAGAFTIHFKYGHHAHLVRETIVPNAVVENLTDALGYVT